MWNPTDYYATMEREHAERMRALDERARRQQRYDDFLQYLFTALAIFMVAALVWTFNLMAQDNGAPSSAPVGPTSSRQSTTTYGYRYGICMTPDVNDSNYGYCYGSVTEYYTIHKRHVRPS
jgi:hypothetical protein